jgi:hypothetical protein
MLPRATLFYFAGEALTMTKEELLRTLLKCNENKDIEQGHEHADQALLAYINDPDITSAFNSINKWYA